MSRSASETASFTRYLEISNGFGMKAARGRLRPKRFLTISSTERPVRLSDIIRDYIRNCPWRQRGVIDDYIVKYIFGTRKKKQGALLDIPVLEHIIIAREGYVSFKEEEDLM